MSFQFFLLNIFLPELPDGFYSLEKLKTVFEIQGIKAGALNMFIMEGAN